jgi:hypothetical protein
MRAWIVTVLAAIVAVGVAYGTGHWRGDSQGFDRAVAVQAAADRKADLERKGDDAKFQNLSQFDLCVAGLRSNRMPVDACEQLRGL